MKNKASSYLLLQGSLIVTAVEEAFSFFLSKALSMSVKCLDNELPESGVLRTLYLDTVLISIL